MLDANDFYAQEFTTGGSCTFQNILASLGDTTGTFTLTAQLVEVTSAASLPDQEAIVDTLTQVGTIPGGMPFANVEFDPTKTDSLDPTKFYWFVLTVSSTDPTASLDGISRTRLT